MKLCSAICLLSGSLLLLACDASGLEAGPGGGGGGGTMGGGDSDSDDDEALAGSITADRTISGPIALNANATVEAGVTLTFAAGSTLEAAEGVSLIVKGTLLVDGSAAAPVTLAHQNGAQSWSGFVADPGGSVTIRYATGDSIATFLTCRSGAIACVLERIDISNVGQLLLTSAPALVKESTVIDMAGGGVAVAQGGDLTIVDSTLYNSQGDIVVVSGGKLKVEYSEIGAAQGGYDHCNFHISSAQSVDIQHTNIVDGVYAVMIGNVTNATFANNNFIGNDTDIDDLGGVLAADLSSNYWENGVPPLGGNFTTVNAVAGMIAEAGPRI